MSPRIVTGRFGRSVRGESREAFIAQSLGQGYICNCPHGNAIGLFFLPVGYVMADKGWSEETVRVGLFLLEEHGLIRYNWDSEWCWVIEGFRHEMGSDPRREHDDGTKEDSRMPLIRDLVAEAAGSGLLEAFMGHHQPAYPYLLGWWDGAFNAPSTGSDTPRPTPRSRARVRVQEQEQEQDVDQDQEDPPNPPAGGEAPKGRKAGRKIPAVDIPRELLAIGIDRDAFAERVEKCGKTKPAGAWQTELDRLAPLVVECGAAVVLDVWRDAIGGAWQGCTPTMVRERAARIGARGGREKPRGRFSQPHTLDRGDLDKAIDF